MRQTLTSHPALTVATAFSCLVLSLTVAGAQTVAIEPQFEDAGHFHEGIAPVKSDGRWGFVDRSGNWVVDPLYTSVKSGSGGRFAVESQGKWGFVNSAGAVVVEPVYDEVQPFKDGVAAVRRGELWGYIGPNGAVDVEFQYSAANPREAGFYTAQLPDGQWVIVDPRGSKDSVSEDPLDSVTGLLEKHAIVTTLEGKRLWAWRGLVSDVVLDVSPYSEGKAAYTVNGKTWGYLDVNGEGIPRKFERARNFAEGLAPVRLNGKWGYIDPTGEWVVQPMYDQAYAFNEGTALVRVGERRGFVRLEGGKVADWIAPKYDDAYRFQEGMAPIKENGLWGYIAVSQSAPLVREIADLQAN